MFVEKWLEKQKKFKNYGYLLFFEALIFYSKKTLTKELTLNK